MQLVYIPVASLLTLYFTCIDVFDPKMTYNDVWEHVIHLKTRALSHKGNLFIFVRSEGLSKHVESREV